MRVVFLLLPLFSAATVFAESGFESKYERDYNIFNPASRYAPNNPFNPANQYNSDNPLNPANRYNPSTPFAPLNQPCGSDR